MTAQVASARPARSWVWRALAALRTLAIGTILCLSPLTSIIALGWLTRRMAALADSRFGQAPEPPGWVMGPPGKGVVVRFAGGLGASIRAGFGTLAALASITLPFTLLWLGAWWAGWENSFNKGYEQAWIGPVTFLGGTLVSLFAMAYLPTALAHLAVERRWHAVFEARRIRAVIAQAGWRQPALAAVTILLALPLFAARGLPTFAGQMAPAIEAMPAEELAVIVGRIDLIVAAYAFISLLVLRHMTAHVYARAATRAAWIDPRLWAGTRARLAATQAPRPSRVLRAVWTALSLGLWLGLAALILVGQFLNYSWWAWLTHPYLLLPWIG